MIPGELLVAPGDIELNVGRKTVRLTVANTGDRPIQVGSHFHFFEANEALRFDRAAARGFRLNIAAGTAVRFEPGQERDIELVALAGDRIVYGFNSKVMGRLDASPPKGRLAARSIDRSPPSPSPKGGPSKNAAARKAPAKTKAAKAAKRGRK